MAGAFAGARYLWLKWLRTLKITRSFHYLFQDLRENIVNLRPNNCTTTGPPSRIDTTKTNTGLRSPEDEQCLYFLPLFLAPIFCNPSCDCTGCRSFRHSTKSPRQIATVGSHFTTRHCHFATVISPLPDSLLSIFCFTQWWIVTAYAMFSIGMPKGVDPGCWSV